MKIVSICGQNNLQECFSYDSIKYNNSNDKETTIKLSELTSASKLNIKTDGFSDLAGFITADGIPFIISYNQKCTSVDPDRPFQNIPDCVAGIYDLNGVKGPNKLGMTSSKGVLSYSGDIKSFNGARLGCVLGIGGVCFISTAYKPSPVNCSDVADELGIECNSSLNNKNDRWSAGAKACKDMGGHLPSYSDLVKLAQIIYDDTSIGSGHFFGVFKNKSVINQLGIDPNYKFYVWDKNVDRDLYAYYRAFETNNTYYGNQNMRSDSRFYTICVSD